MIFSSFPNPVLAIITAIIVATVLLIEHWKDIKKIICDVMESIKVQIHSIKQFLDKLSLFETIHRGIEKTKILLNKLSTATISLSTTKSSLQQPWGQQPIGANHLMQRLRDERFNAQRQEAALRFC